MFASRTGYTKQHRASRISSSRSSYSCYQMSKTSSYVRHAVVNRSYEELPSGLNDYLSPQLDLPLARVEDVIVTGSR